MEDGTEGRVDLGQGQPAVAAGPALRVSRPGEPRQEVQGGSPHHPSLPSPCRCLWLEASPLPLPAANAHLSFPLRDGEIL